VAPPVFKTGERCAVALAGSIPVRLRRLAWQPGVCGSAAAQRLVRVRMLVLADLTGDLTQAVAGEPRRTPGHDDMYAADGAQVELGVHGAKETHGQVIPNWAHRITTLARHAVISVSAPWRQQLLLSRPRRRPRVLGASCTARLGDAAAPGLHHTDRGPKSLSAATSGAICPPGADYPGAGGGLWLRMIFPPGLFTWLVPSG
jgi:hypothetical protein